MLGFNISLRDVDPCVSLCSSYIYDRMYQYLWQEYTVSTERDRVTDMAE